MRVMSGRRQFLEWSAAALAALRPARGAAKPPEVFAEIAGHRLIGLAALAARGLRVGVTVSSYPGGSRYALTAANSSAAPLLLDKVGLILRVPSASAAPRRWRVFLDSGVSGATMVKRLDALQANPHLQPARAHGIAFHRSDLQTVVWDAASSQAFLAGFLRQRFGRNKVDVIPDATASGIDRLEAWQDFGLELAPGAVQPLDPLVVAAGRDPYALLETFAERVRLHHGRVFDAPPIVGMMTWYGYAAAIDEEIVLGNAEIIAELFGGYPQKMQTVMLCDHGWQQDANWGNWQPDAARFPHGMEWLAQRLARLGIDLGLWSTPFNFTEDASNLDRLLPLQLLDAQLRPRRRNLSVWGSLPGQPATWPVGILDGGKEAVQEFWGRMIARMKNWGVRYWKLDFFSLETSPSQARRLGLGELYARTWRTLRAAAGPESHLAPCSCSTNLQLGYDDSVRIAADIGNAGLWPEHVESFRYGMGTIAALWYKHRNFWVNDADSIQIAKGCSLAEARVRATVVALSGGHLMVSEDLRRVDPARLEILRRLLPAYPRAARPLDLFENPAPEGYPALWSLSLPTGFGPMTVLAVFNLTDRVREFEIRPAMLGIPSGREFAALEWWQSRWLGRFRGAFRLQVPPLDVALIHAQPTREEPWLVSSSHHFTGGYIVENVAFDPASGALRGELVTRLGLRTVLHGCAPGSWNLTREEAFHTVNGPTGLWQSEVVTTSTRTPFTIRFRKA
jgi:hypothetical protein